MNYEMMGKTMKNNDIYFEAEMRQDNKDFKFYCYKMPDENVEIQQVPLHWDMEMEIVYSEAHGTLFVNDKSYEMVPGSIFFVNPRVLHRTFRKSHGLMVHIVFDLNILKTLSNSNPYNELIDDILKQNRKFKEIVPFDSEIYRQLLPIIHSIMEYCEKTVSYGFESYTVTSYLFMVFSAAIKSHHFEYINMENLYGIRYVTDAIRYIEEHYPEFFTITELAQRINVSPTYLYQLFHDYVGTTPINYINSIRLRAAYKLLSAGQNVTETAIAVGIPNTSYFIKLFKSATGTTPKNWAASKRKHN